MYDLGIDFGDTIGSVLACLFVYDEDGSFLTEAGLREKSRVNLPSSVSGIMQTMMPEWRNIKEIFSGGELPPPN